LSAIGKRIQAPKAPRGVVCATVGGIWEGGCAPPQKMFSNLGLKYTICDTFWVLFQFSLAGFNASNAPDDLDYLLIFY